MAQRRWLQTVTRHVLPLLSSKPTTSLKPLPHLPAPISLKCIVSPKPLQQFLYTDPTLFDARSFSSSSRDDSENEEDDGEEEEDYDSDSNEAEVDDVTVSDMKREYSAEEKEAEAAAIGYKVIGPLLSSDRVLKHREPVFAVVQVGSHQFKVSNGDCIYVERLKFCEVNDKLILNKVLMLGTSAQTIIGRPILPDAAVHAVVEEHALDAKVIIFKKKRRKNYRRTKGHRQELTRLRIADIQGIEKPQPKVDPKQKLAAVKQQEKVAVAA
ncbi:PREDICTED: 50S ribosomal protein L21, mitochondrial [Populus euphratica]|uniref:Large ribosomal subunit protein bL21m n=1 Tax=Populus euphratica TaxID=75702 RepID=A0AAJ6U820_POPEU|nr:PREDICTED: 50S ribosomal protein L21, mitochondrial [Populus euphratica]XP_011024018.1 PREDICTED: 50S ribosomal protein L21, mitochondrial [Populus euphratica]XP_011024019.1 PREDICTED: 50S ribosomal protein L21, mitochondrial [Populus euphratica]XP_011024020.1 PREDICTED: 50S ribosomal protein L21, mitochondrial [Populus euphratica]